MNIEENYYSELKQKFIDNAPSKEEYSTFTKKEKDSYQLSLKVDRDLMNSYETAYKSAYERAYEEGYQKGIKLGIAKKLLNILDIETIASKTGLTVEEIEKLR